MNCFVVSWIDWAVWLGLFSFRRSQWRSAPITAKANQPPIQPNLHHSQLPPLQASFIKTFINFMFFFILLTGRAAEAVSKAKTNSNSHSQRELLNGLCCCWMASRSCILHSSSIDLFDFVSSLPPSINHIDHECSMQPYCYNIIFNQFTSESIKNENFSFWICEEREVDCWLMSCLLCWNFISNAAMIGYRFCCQLIQTIN